MNAIRSLFGRRATWTPPPTPVYAIGDVHGRRDLLFALINKIHVHAAGRKAEIIFLGDYIDRGPHSAGVIDLLLESPRLARFETLFLKGNHEATLLEFLDDPGVGPSWAQFGGLETLMSYGVRPPALKSDAEAWAKASKELNRALPDAHRRFLSSLELQVTRGDYLFVHAGVDPEKALEEQTERDLLWIREEFLDNSRRLKKMIVHGHSPDPTPYLDRRRIGVDTGAYQTGILTAVFIDANGTEFIST
jgi:serine/threonine protein phosphatase 1